MPEARSVAAASRLLRLARRRREWSQAEFARRAGIPASQLCAYETGAKQPGTSTLVRLLAIAGYELYLAEPKFDRVRQSQELAQVLELVDAMPPSRDRPAPPTFRQLQAS